MIYPITKRKAGIAIGVAIAVTLVLSSVAYLALLVPGANADDKNDNGNHCTATVSSENIGNNAIQTAINAASSGDTVCVAAGTYPEQLSIAKPLTLRGLGDEHAPTIIKPTSVVANACRQGGSVPGPTASSCSSGNPTEAAIILAAGTTGVTIKQVVVDGSTAATGSSPLFTSCAAPRFDGILFSGASGSVSDSQVTNVYQSSSSLYGCQDDAGLGIYVQSPASTTSKVSIRQNTVTNYQKNGITCNDAGSTCSVDGNTVSPLAAAQLFVASNGIQIGFGAVGEVSDNTVTGNECNLATVCGPNLVTQTQSAGILTFQSGAGTTLKDNTVSGNDMGIATVNDAVTSSGNTVQNNRDEGMLLNDGTYSASNNRVSCDHSTTCQIGVAVDSDGFVASATSANLKDNSFKGTFATSLIQVITYSNGLSGGPNTEPATLTLDGVTETVTGGSSSNPAIDNPAIVNITVV